MNAQPRSAVHMPELDGVRGMAILLVMALHFLCSLMQPVSTRAEFLVARITAYGDLGVELFFVLSGFLITGILADTRGRPDYFRRFFVRRTVRIFPLYYLVVAVFALLPVSWLARHAPDALVTREKQLWLWTYLTNVEMAGSTRFDIPYLSHFWTLAVEEHFYAVWPLLVGRFPRTRTLRIALVLIGAALVGRLVTMELWPGVLASHVLTPFRLDALCAGAALALASRGPLGLDGVGLHAKRAFPWLALTWLALEGVRFATKNELVAGVQTTCTALVFGAAVMLAVTPSGPRVYRALLRARWLGWFGKYSYGLYVYHAILTYVLKTRGGSAYLEPFVGSKLAAVVLQAALATGVSCAIAVVSFALFEQPFLRLKDRLEPSTPSKAPTTPGPELTPTPDHD